MNDISIPYEMAASQIKHLIVSRSNGDEGLDHLANELAEIVEKCEADFAYRLLLVIAEAINQKFVLPSSERLDQALSAKVFQNCMQIRFLQSDRTHDALSQLGLKRTVAEITRQLMAMNDEKGLVYLIGTLTYYDVSKTENIQGLVEGMGLAPFLDSYSALMLYPNAPDQTRTIDTLIDLHGEGSIVTQDYMDVMSETLNNENKVGYFLESNIMNARVLHSRPILKKYIFDRIEHIVSCCRTLPDPYLLKLAKEDGRLLEVFDLYLQKLKNHQPWKSDATTPCGIVSEHIMRDAMVFYTFGKNASEVMLEIIRNAGLADLKPRLDGIPQDVLKRLVKHPGIVDARAVAAYPELKRMKISEDFDI